MNDLFKKINHLTTTERLDLFSKFQNQHPENLKVGQKIIIMEMRDETYTPSENPMFSYEKDLYTGQVYNIAGIHLPFIITIELGTQHGRIFDLRKFKVQRANKRYAEQFSKLAAREYK